MTRKLPDCAWCGKPLAGNNRGRVTVDFPDAVGFPLIGWHGECVTKDEEWVDVAYGCQGDQNMDPPPDDWIPEAVKEAYNRGPSRVTARKKFWEIIGEVVEVRVPR
jgi:hypothetical protein